MTVGWAIPLTHRAAARMEETVSTPLETTRPCLDVGTLYRRHGGVVYRRVRSFYTADQAEEVCNEVWERVVRSAATWRGDSSPVTWLFQVTTRHCLNRMRNAKRRRELSEAHGDPTWAVPTTRADQEVWTCLRQLWRELEPELVQIGLLHFRDGLSHAQIAEQIGCSKRTIGNRIAKLRELADQAARPREEGSP